MLYCIENNIIYHLKVITMTVEVIGEFSDIRHNVFN